MKEMFLHNMKFNDKFQNTIYFKLIPDYTVI